MSDRSSLVHRVLNHPILKPLAKNTIWLFSAELALKCTITLLGIMIARYFSLEQYGSYSVAFGFSALFTFVVDFGISTSLTKDISQSPDRISVIIKQTLASKLLLSGLSWLLIPFVGYILGRNGLDLRLITIFGFYIGINSLNIYFHSIFRASQAMVQEGIAKLFQAGILILFCTIGFFRNDITLIAWGFVIASTLSLVYMIWKTRLYMKSTSWLSLRWHDFSSTIQSSWVFGLSGFLALINLNFDAVMLGLSISNEVAGVYSALYTVLVALLFIINIFFVPIFPLMAQRYKDTRFLKKIFFWLWVGCCIVGAIGGTSVFMLQEPILQILYGESISIFHPILGILSLVFAISILKFPGGYILSSTGNQRYYLMVLLLSASTNVILNIIFIPQYGMVAAAWTTAVSETINAILLTIIPWRILTSVSQPY